MPGMCSFQHHEEKRGEERGWMEGKRESETRSRQRGAEKGVVGKEGREEKMNE